MGNNPVLVLSIFPSIARRPKRSKKMQKTDDDLARWITAPSNPLIRLVRLVDGASQKLHILGLHDTITVVL